VKIARPKRRAPYVPTTSFGDIAFLLIIFFMVSSVFMEESHIEVGLPASRDIDRVDEVPVSVILDRQGNLWLQGQPCAKEALEAAVAALISDSKEKRVAVKIDRDREQKEYGDIMLAIAGAGADIVLLGEKEAR
jgi:biopolymer transport protein ExbD